MRNLFFAALKREVNIITDITWNKISIPNQENLGLSTMLLDNGKSDLIIVTHGFTGSKEGGGRAIEMGEALAEIGFSTILFDFAGCGESDGRFEDITLSSHTNDLEAIVKWSRQYGFKNIILTGRSFGGSTIINYSYRDRSIYAICTWAAVAKLKDLFNKFAGKEITGSPEQLIAIHGEEETVYLKKQFFYDLMEHDLLKASANLDLQGLLIIHGSADESVPVEDAHLLYESAPEPKELAVIDGADHRFSNHIDQVWEKFFTWLSQIIS